MDSSHLEFAKEFLTEEARAVSELPSAIDSSFDQACARIIDCAGRVIWMGVGQSWHVARKTSCSMASLGRPSFYVHATEAVHGDMGLITRNDIVILISHSGRTKEVVETLGPIRAIGAQTIAIVGKSDSKLGAACDVVLTTGVREEAGPYKFAPSSSALATTALGDALVMAVARAIGFTAEDYAKYHPGGSAGEDLSKQGKGV